VGACNAGVRASGSACLSSTERCAEGNELDAFEGGASTNFSPPEGEWSGGVIAAELMWCSGVSNGVGTGDGSAFLLEMESVEASMGLAVDASADFSGG